MRKLFVLPAVVLAGVLGVASPANAASFYDSWKDVQSSPIGDEDAISPDPTRLIGDITKTTVVFSGDALRITTSYRALPRAGRTNVHVMRVKTSKVERFINILAQPGDWSGKLTLTKPQGTARVADEINPFAPASCQQFKYLIEYSQKRIVVVIPTACLKNPSFVRVGSGFTSLTSDHIFFDDTFTTQSAPSDGLVLGPAVHDIRAIAVE